MHVFILLLLSSIGYGLYMHICSIYSLLSSIAG